MVLYSLQQSTEPRNLIFLQSLRQNIF